MNVACDTGSSNLWAPNFFEVFQALNLLGLVHVGEGLTFYDEPLPRLTRLFGAQNYECCL